MDMQDYSPSYKEKKGRYPIFLVAIKWIFGMIELGGGVFILLKYNDLLGIFYGIYVVSVGAFVLPLSSCKYCFYYGKRCHSGWGWITSLLYEKGKPKFFEQSFVWRIFLYPIWLIPFIGALALIMRLRNLESLIIFAGYSLILFLNHRSLMKYLACKTCAQKYICPGCQYKTINS